MRRALHRVVWATRLPSTAVERRGGGIFSLYELGAEGGTPENAFRLLIEAFVQSPSFLYHIDVPASGEASEAAASIDAYALASRLSYFLWTTMPDAALLDQSGDGSLLQPGGDRGAGEAHARGRPRSSGKLLEIPHPRAGLLTLPAVMTKLSHASQTSPVHRGILVRENLRCQHVPPPPPGVNNALPPATEATTTRERVELHTGQPACAGCHAVIDPLGMAFENYDPVGAFRTEDGIGPVDATGAFLGTRRLERRFSRRQ